MTTLRSGSPSGDSPGDVLCASTEELLAVLDSSRMIWADHDVVWLVATPGNPDPFVVLGHLARRDLGVDLGVVLAPGDTRAPSIATKLITTVDVISGGRAQLAWATGIGDGAELERLGECWAIQRAMMATGDDAGPTFAGAYFSIAGAVNRPGPRRDRGVPCCLVLNDAPLDPRLPWDRLDRVVVATGDQTRDGELLADLAAMAKEAGAAQVALVRGVAGADLLAAGD